VGEKSSMVAAFEAFVAARGPALLRTAFLLTGDHGRAEDLVQTALGKTWPRWESIEDFSREGYVRKVMVTTYIAWWRRRWTAEYPSDTLPEQASWGPNVELRHDVLKALASLPKGQRAVIVARFFDDLTEVQTAALLGCSVGTVKSQNARALAALRRCPALAVTQGELR
jgi:RNA polymerase sigma-70 factor (sigma-E family)